MATFEGNVCPYCNQTRSTTTRSAIATISLAEKTSHIQREVQRVEDLITKLHHQRSVLLQHLNEIQSPISILPPETLSVVFQYASPKPRFEEVSQFIAPRQFTLGAVSVLWRQTLLSTPSLWAAVELDILPNMMDKRSSLLRAFLIHSGDLPLSIGLRYHNPTASHHTREPEFLISPTVDPILYENAHRIRGLHLSKAHSPWINYIPHLTNLVDLTLSIQSALNRTPSDLILDNVPCSQLILSSFRARVQLYWSAITILHLSLIPIDVSLELLVKCTNLLEYKVVSPIQAAASGAAFAIPNYIFVLPRLEVFQWVVDLHRPIDIAMLRFIQMPALRRLVWVTANTHAAIPGIPESAKVFFDRLPMTLTTLEIRSTHVWTDGSVFDHLHDELRIENLVISSCVGDFPRHVLRRLSSSGGGSMRLPQLKSISFVGTQGEQALIVDVLEHRFLHGTQSFRLEFKYCTTPWLSKFREKAKELVDDGLKLEVIVDERSMDLT
ncbi:hypothetical protein P691DRAFT_225406 [Macrolepiota fuliginosa MF-IS2]|uniref:F-box domain-containing protein n=1 Tax=Macrolepiota fuliginosa MF-IS2 TaxID=1400762 RepID=A0A9P5X7Q8_9AGAR|nr:hypothetical protein P691DRAFT_225406 [Macrolepiota fuliginosa MF-IS2]